MVDFVPVLCKNTDLRCELFVIFLLIGITCFYQILKM